MSNQPTGDYRLVPWAYPPIPGGSNNSDRYGTPYDFSNLRVNYATTPEIHANGHQIMLHIIGQDFLVLNTEGVTTISVAIIPVKLVDSSGDTITGQAHTLTRSNYVIDQFVSPVEIYYGYNMTMFDTDADLPPGDLQVADMNITIDVLNAAGETMQHWEGLVSI